MKQAAVAVAVLGIIAGGTSAGWAQSASAGFDVPAIVENLCSRSDPFTHLVLSHSADPRFVQVGFLYDQAVAALLFHAAGYPAQAEDLLDTLAAVLEMPLETVREYADSNSVCGMVKLIDREDGTADYGLLNGLDISARSWQGAGAVDYFTTPGPQAMLICAFCRVNPQRYFPAAAQLGRTLLRWQQPDGGIIDGDRTPDTVYTEPQLTCAAAFDQLFAASGEERWQSARERALDWIEQRVLDAETGTLAQGYQANRRREVFATDCYSWGLAGPLGDRLSSEQVAALTETMLRRALVGGTVALPDGRTESVTLADFTDFSDPAVEKIRGGSLPCGSVEWTGGVILALQKSAVRLWQDNSPIPARRYKAVAELLLRETVRCFYAEDSGKGLTTFYANGQNLCVGPFFSAGDSEGQYWKTPYYHLIYQSHEITGGSIVGFWPLLPGRGINPFCAADQYYNVYETIAVDEEAQADAIRYVRQLTQNRNFPAQTIPELTEEQSLLFTPAALNSRMWRYINAAFRAEAEQDTAGAQEQYRQVLMVVRHILGHDQWRRQAQQENQLKQAAFGGIIYYPWGATYGLNAHPLHAAILRYPLLNEMGAAMWAAVTAHAALGENEPARLWIDRIRTEIPLHQIPDMSGDLIQGYWNALDAWINNPNGDARNESIGRMLQELTGADEEPSVVPPVVELPEPAAFGLLQIARYDTGQARALQGINRNVWQALETARQLQTRKDPEAEDFYLQAISWAEKLTDSVHWTYFGRCDNLRKQQIWHGIIQLPEPAQRDPRKLTQYHNCIDSFSLSNQIASAYWGMAETYAALGQPETSQQWMRRLIDNVPLHQFPDNTIGLSDLTDGGADSGFWNAIRYWQALPESTAGSIFADLLQSCDMSGISLPVTEFDDNRI